MAQDVKTSPNQDAHEQLKALGKYHIHKRLGAGGMGAVFLATDTDLKRTVALKVLPKDRAENPILVRRFKAEAQAVAQLRHDNIVAIYEASQIDGFPYIALEYVEGIDVLSLIDKRGIVPPKRSLNIVLQVAQALQHAHEKNIVHRDIKPSNLLIRPDGVVKLTDLGLARSVDETLDTSITRAGTTVGTVDYISPEQACDSKAADVRSDIYSLGCTWFHMLTGAPPYVGDMKNKLHGHLHTLAPDPRHDNPNVPEAYVAVMHRMMAKKPQDRYQTPSELMDDLEKVASASAGVTSELMEGLGQDAPRQPIPATAEIELGEPSRKDPRLVKRAEKAKRNKPPRSARSGVAQPQPAEDLEAGEVDEETTRKSRKLPPRKQKSPTGLTIDLDYARVAMVGVLVLGIVGAFWWAFSRGSEPAPNGAEDPGALAARRDAVPVAEADGASGAPDEAPPTEPPTPQVSLVASAGPRVSRAGPAFPGTDDLPGPDSGAVREYVPDWVYAAREASTAEMPTITVEAAPKPGAAGSIVDGIRSLRGPRRRVILSGDGVFALQAMEVRDVTHLQIRAAPGSDPLLVFPKRDSTSNSIFGLTNGVLELEGVHLLAAAAPEGANPTLLQVRDGTIILRNCTVTVGHEAGPVTVCHVENVSPDAAARVLFERTLVRGESVTAARARGRSIDIVSGGSLLASVNGPLLDIEITPPEPVATADAEAETPASDEPDAHDDAEPESTAASEPSHIRLLGSVLVSGGAALRLEQPASTAVGRCRVLVRRSVLAAAQTENATLLALASWPSRATNLSGQSRVAGLTWRQERSRLGGWPHLVRLKTTSGTDVVSGADQWQDFWARPIDSDSIAPAVEGLKPGVAGDALRKQLTTAAVGGTTIGAADALPEPPRAAMDRWLLLEGRPRLPEGFRELPEAEIVRVDLKSQHTRLNEILGDTPDGSRVQLVGVGLVALPPIHLRGKRLQIEFVHEGEGAQLVVRPDSVRGKPPEASIFIEGGRLDLINARIQSSPSRSRAYPPRLILVQDGELTLHNCSIDGPLHDEAPTEPLIEFRRSDGERRYAYIADSLIVSRQPLVSADADRGLFVVHNTVLAGAGDCLTLRSSAGNARIPRAERGWMILDHCTFLTGGAALRMAGPSAGRDDPAVHVLSTASVFAPAPGLSPKDAVLLRHPAGMTPQNLFDWWEDRNGYAASLQQFRATGDTADVEAQQFDPHWARYWGASHVERPLTGQNGVIFKTVLSSLENLRPQDLSLASNAGGARWAPDGGVIGARVDVVGPKAVEPSAPSSGTVNAPGGTPRRPTGRPDF